MFAKLNHVSGGLKLAAGALLVLGLGLPISPAYAHCKGKHTGDHEHCTGGEPPVTAMKQEIVTVQRLGRQRTKIVVMNADGTDVQVVLESERKVAFRYVSWSRDGSKVLFSADLGDGDGIYWIKVFDLNETTGDRLAFAPGEPQLVIATTGKDSRWSPIIAPDGREWIVYREGDPWQIWLVEANPPNEKIKLTLDTDRDKYHPSWSPDGGRIAFLSVPSEVPCSCPGDVEILHLRFNPVTGDPEMDTDPGKGRVSLLVNNPNPSEELDALKAQLANDLFWNTDFSNTIDPENGSGWIVTPRNGGEIWVFPTNPADVALKAKAINTERRDSSIVWSPNDDALLYGGETCNISDSDLGKIVVAPLAPDPPFEIESVSNCDATPIAESFGWYEWWRGGEGDLPPFAP